jgi:hypothetical protein
MSTLGIRLLFPGGMERSPVAAWLIQRMVAVRECLDEGLPEAALTLLYSGIDALGWLGAPADAPDASKASFVDWCTQYLLPKLNPRGENEPTAMDLYASRCRVLHTFLPESQLGREGNEIWYRFRGKSAVNPMRNASQVPLVVEIERLVHAFDEGGRAFVADLNRDQNRLRIAEERADRFFSWDKVERAI